MILLRHMQENPEEENNAVEELIRQFTSIQLSTMRYEKLFNVIEDIIMNEHWEEMNKLVIAAKECENHVCKIHENMRSINSMLFNNGIKCLSDKKN